MKLSTGPLLFSALIAICLCGRSPHAGALPAFPGAEGFGAVSRGGRGGTVIKVTTLAASGPGSLKAACAASGPRIVVFDVSGVIRADIQIASPYITIAGQTAPGAGITVEGLISSYGKGVHDVIIRHLRVRPRPSTGVGGDALQLGDSAPNRAYNIMLDHLSLSWASDEVIDLIAARAVTVQWSTIEESDPTGHPKGAHNFGLLSAYPGSGKISLHHNLWAHHDRRVPAVAPYEANAPADFRNNVVYNVRNALGHAGHSSNIKSAINCFNNYIKRGPDTLSKIYPFATFNGVSYYIKDNYIVGWGLQGNPKDWSWSGTPSWIQFNQNGTRLTAAAAVTPKITTHTAQQAYTLVLKEAGAWPRDRVTLRTINEVKAGTGKQARNGPSAPTDAWYLQGLTKGTAPKDTDKDGMPDTWETNKGLDPNKNDSTRTMPSGYTAIEDYINERAAALLGKKPPVTLDGGGVTTDAAAAGDASVAADAGAGAGDAAGQDNDLDGDGACSCQLGGAPSSRLGGLFGPLAIVVLVALVAVRRSRQSARQRA